MLINTFGVLFWENDKFNAFINNKANKKVNDTMNKTTNTNGEKDGF